VSAPPSGAAPDREVAVPAAGGGRPRRVRSQIIDEMLARRRSGESLHDIGIAYGYTSDAAVLYLLRGRGGPSVAEVHAARRANSRDVTERTVRDQEMAQARAAGATLAQIGEQYGLSRERVRQILQRVQPTASRRRNTTVLLPRWTDEELANWLALFVRDSGGPATTSAYAAWAHANPGAPSAFTIGKRLGGWRAALSRDEVANIGLPPIQAGRSEL